MFYTFFENRVVCEIMRKNIVHPDRPQMTIWHMGIACRISKVTVTNLKYVIITAFPLQNLLHQRASMLRYMYIACLVPFAFHIAVQLHFKQLCSRLLLCHHEPLEHQELYFSSIPTSLLPASEGFVSEFRSGSYSLHLFSLGDPAGSTNTVCLELNYTYFTNQFFEIFAHFGILDHLLQLNIFLRVLLQLSEGN